MHFMFGIDHTSTFPLLVHRVCEGLQHCISPSHFLVVMHSNTTTSSGTSKSEFDAASELLNIIGVTVSVEHGLFTSNNKMMISLERLREIPIPIPIPSAPAAAVETTSPLTLQYGAGLNGIIYHSDLDEVPDLKLFEQALREMQLGECDAIRGYWEERLTRSGTPTSISLDMRTLDEQFPYRCNISAQFMPVRTTVKIIAYRPNYRLVSGQHDIWCNVPRQTSKGREWDQGIACRAHIRGRQDKSTPMKDIFMRLPKPGLPPRICSTLVPISHYKFIPGVVQSLSTRVEIYKRLNFVWWKQSNELLQLLVRGNGSIDMSAPEFKCR